MIEKIDDFLVGIDIGIRYRQNFAVTDRLGEIIDNILYAEDAYFIPIKFPHIGGTPPYQRQLFNPKTQNTITIDPQNTVLEILFSSEEEKDGYHRGDLDDIHQNFEQKIIKGVLKEVDVHEIIRIGYVKHYCFKDKPIIDSFLKISIISSFQDINEINLNFSKKIPLQDSILKKEINNYDNVIINISKAADEDEIFINVDYQKFFDPKLIDINRINYPQLIHQADDFSNGRVLPWLNKNFSEG